MYAAKDILEMNNAALLQMRKEDHAGTLGWLQEALIAMDGMGESSLKKTTARRDPPVYQSAKKRPRRSHAMMPTKHDAQQQPEEVEQEETEQQQVNDEGQIGIICSVRVVEDEEQAFIAPPQELDNVLTFFDRAFTFLNYQNLDLTSVENKSSMTAMVLYNMGLSHHRRGIKLGQSQDLALAMRFYRLAHSVLDEVKSVVGISVHLLLLMALLNNMGHIHASSYNIGQTNRCIEWLKRALASRHAAVLEADDFTFFLAFVKIVPTDAFKFAPAA